MMEITDSFVKILNSQDNYPVVKIDSFEELNNYLNNSEFLVVMRAGNVICNPSTFLKKLKSIPDDIGLVGHILKTHLTETPYLHDQMMILRSSVFDNLNFDSITDFGKELVRSTEDLHDGRAPLYVKFGDNIVERKYKFGTKLLIDCLSKKYRVTNFDEDWRWNKNHNTNFVSLDEVNKYLSFKLDYFPVKGYCYPQNSTQAFSQALKKLDFVPNLDSAQEIFIATFKEALKFKILNAWTFDVLFNEVPFKEISVCPATGFFGEVTAVKAKSNTLVLYDKNPHNINFKRDLYQYWNGTNYKDFVFNWVKDTGLRVEPIFDYNNERKEMAYLQAEEVLFPVWNQWKSQIKVEFKTCDLIVDYDQLITEPDKSLIYTSTILDEYPVTHIMYEQEQLELVKNKINSSGIFWLK